MVLIFLIRTVPPKSGPCPALSLKKWYETPWDILNVVENTAFSKYTSNQRFLKSLIVYYLTIKVISFLFFNSTNCKMLALYPIFFFLGGYTSRL